MIRLNPSTDPRWVELLAGLRIKVAPITTAVMASVRADATLDLERLGSIPLVEIRR